MSERLKYVLAGSCVGFAELLPGISGSTVAIFFGIYEKIIKVLSEIRFKNITLDLKKLNNIFSLELMVPFIISMIISVLIFSNFILFLHNEFTLIFNITLGLIMIIGGYLLAHAEVIKFKLDSLGFYILGFITSFALTTISNNSIDINFINLILAGFVAFSFFLIPGISGSAILLVFGLYTTIIESVANLNFTVLTPFAIGASISLLVMPKAISYLFEQFREFIIVFFSGLIIGTGLILLF
jgi:putative membrane protein|tara:strand:- start:2970 stop:3692 length:723 start_codon:yes stop_codon:yes gene_type:complete